METLIILLCVWSVAVTAYLTILHHNMISQNKINKNNNDIHKELLDISKDIANKVISIEKRVDELNN